MAYFVYVGRLVNFVRETGLIIFTGWNPEGMTEIVRDSAGLINLTKESF